MAKCISQDIFDSVVQENIADFDMAPEEAMQDAVTQFKAQGINLSNIVQDLHIFDSSDGRETPRKHTILAALEELKDKLAKKDCPQEEFLEVFKNIKAECDLDISRRCLAGSNGAFSLFSAALNKFKDSDLLLQSCLDAMCSLCSGQPDLMTTETVVFLSNILASSPTSQTALLVIKLIRLNCTMHEKNRQYFVAENIISLLIKMLDSHRNNAPVVKEVCAMLRVLTLDDDVRVPFGKGHEHAKMIVTEENALKKILAICSDFKNDKMVLSTLFATLGRLSVRNEFCQEVLDNGGLELILPALDNNIEHLEIVKQALWVQKAIAGNDEVKKAIVQNNGLELDLAAMQRHQLHAGIAEAGCAVIAVVVLRQPEHCTRVMMNNGAEILVKAMQLHPDNAKVQKTACLAVRNLVGRNPEYKQPFIELGIESLLNKALAKHSSINDEAKAALRDLELKVELKCLWTGEGKGIQQ